MISVIIYAIVSVVLILVEVGILMLIALVPFAVIAVIIAAIRANNGQEFRYPMTIRVIK